MFTSTLRQQKVILGWYTSSLWTCKPLLFSASEYWQNHRSTIPSLWPGRIFMWGLFGGNFNCYPRWGLKQKLLEIESTRRLWWNEDLGTHLPSAKVLILLNVNKRMDHQTVRKIGLMSWGRREWTSPNPGVFLGPVSVASLLLVGRQYSVLHKTAIVSISGSPYSMKGSGYE